VDDEPTGRIIYTCQIQGDEICIINPDKTGWRRLTDTPLASFNATLSPDGKTVVYIVSDGSTSEIHELEVDSGRSSQLTFLGTSLGSPEISPDNNLIVFHYREGGGNLQLWIMDRDGGDPREFYSVAGRDAHDGTWSPDGSQILFAFGRAENNKLYVIDLNGREPRLLNDSIDTRGRSDWSDQRPDLARYGDPFKHEVYLMNADGSDLRQVSQPGMNSQGASLSPDGQWIAYTAYTNVTGDLNSCEIFIMRIDGTDVRQLTKTAIATTNPAGETEYR
jgi:TolB protein